jgi:hypothetical protein
MATPTAGGILRIGSYAGIAGALLGGCCSASDSSVTC